MSDNLHETESPKSESADLNRYEFSAEDGSPASEPSSSDNESSTDDRETFEPSGDRSAKYYDDKKWERVREFYSDQYLELFNTTFQHGKDEELLADLPATQL